MTTPRGLPDRVWIVVQQNSQRLIVDRGFNDGVEKWAEGTNVTVVEYVFSKVVHTPPKKKAKKP